MTSQEISYFDELTKDRSENADVLEKPSMRGTKNSVVEKYSDQAHFIYELLQNADDAKATEVRFELCKDKLIFAHNGTRHFSVSNPKTEDEDSNSGKLGDINAITSIANSNKKTSSIGKFGVGFKAVFQYTSTPYIYDPNIFFKIERFIVPKKIKKDIKERKPNETMFIFPFDHPERTAEEAMDDISNKLTSLTFPILFLNNLKNITFKCDENSGGYNKVIEKSFKIDNTIAQLISLEKYKGNEIVKERLWLFSRMDENNLKYSVGYFLDDEGNLIGKDYSAFCFFPTKEVTGLKFIIHAPFLLTDSREGIKAAESHNKQMIKLLSKLSADCLIYLKEIGQREGYSLINDNLFTNIIPYSEDTFSDINDRSKISFKPFYNAIKEKLKTEELLPSFPNYFAKKENSYWAYDLQIAEVFSNAQLSYLLKKENAMWVFTSLGRRVNNRELTYYIDDLVNDWINDDKILKNITSDFIESQSIEWLCKFYKYILDAKSRIDTIKTIPIFKDENGNAVSAFDENKQEILFLPMNDVEGYKTINIDLFNNKETKELAQQLGIKEPSLRDEIYNIILPQYKNNNEGINTEPHFIKFFKYYKQCPQIEVDDYIELIKKYKFIKYSSFDNNEVYRGNASDLYMPTEELTEYFKAKPNTHFVKLNEYKNLIDKSDEQELLIHFLKELGVNFEPKIIKKELKKEEALERGYNWKELNYESRWAENIIDGCQQLIELIIKNADVKASIELWNQLLRFIKSQCFKHTKIENIICGIYKHRQDGRYNFKYDKFESKDSIYLKNQPWLLNTNNEFVSAKNITIETLSKSYNTSKEEAKELIEFLNIKETESSEESDNNLSEEQLRKIKLANKIEAAGITEEELELIIQQKKKKIESNKKSIINENILLKDEKNYSVIEPIVKDIEKRTITKNTQIKNNNYYNETVIDFDEDEYIKPSIDYSKKIEQAKQRSAIEINKIAQLEELQKQALDCEKYSFGWFKALLELEVLNSRENSINSREISISFAKVEREVGTSRTLILKHPNRNIPQFMEELSDIPLVLHYGEQSKTVAVEVVNVKSYTLRAKLKTNAEIEGIDLSIINEACIQAKNPVFILEELYKHFLKLGFDNKFNMQKNLCENIDFVFGPPGTGKTTYIVKNILIPIMKKTENLKVLVLTPTNKASDVIINRIMEVMGENKSYKEWLIRFGITNDEIIEDSGVYCEKTFDIRILAKNVTVTTIARFPYDYFMPNGNTRLYISEMNWDYIVIDEASMIPLVNIIFPLYKKTPKKFIIAGDPFQIEPITSVDLWKNENIYTMVKLNSFSTPSTIPHKYHVQLLTTQYRSIPDIGEVFSKFTYDGVLKHNRTENSKRKLNIEEISIESLNLIKFPVSKYESIYRPKRLQGKSNYQVYSALFSFEFVKYLAIKLSFNNEIFKIGIIAPYKAQADLIDKLLASESLPKNIDVQVGTIHGFQGDECDIIIAVFNPPPKISNSKEMFLNNQNIINVSISRARDYLFIIMPDDKTENVDNLSLIKQVEHLCKMSDKYTENDAQNIEKLIFNNEHYLEENSFSTSHQVVNVYGLPEKRYEIRSEDIAIDIQIHNSDD